MEDSEDLKNNNAALTNELGALDAKEIQQLHDLQKSIRTESVLALKVANTPDTQTANKKFLLDQLERARETTDTIRAKLTAVEERRERVEGLLKERRGERSSLRRAYLSLVSLFLFSSTPLFHTKRTKPNPPTLNCESLSPYSISSTTGSTSYFQEVRRRSAQTQEHQELLEEYS